jgi:hypothetical protein
MARKVIALKGVPEINEEEVALEAITPGQLLMYGTGGVQKNTENDKDVSHMFALEREELSNGIDVAYAINDVVKVGVFNPGQRVYAWLASGQNVAKGDYLTGNATGLLTAASTNPRIAQALEAVNATTGTARIRVQVV